MPLGPMNRVRQSSRAQPFVGQEAGDPDPAGAPVFVADNGHVEVGV
jgi:hypothetical protein